MRRRDRETDLILAYEIIDNSDFGVLSLAGEEGIPYGIPLSIVRKDEFLYFHSALEGRKADILKLNSKVSVAFVSKNQVPDIYLNQELDEIVMNNKNAGHLLGGKVFTTEFESAIVKGITTLVDDDKERIAGLRLICEKYTPDKMKYFQYAIDASLKITAVYKIEIEEVSGKKKSI